MSWRSGPSPTSASLAPRDLGKRAERLDHQIGLLLAVEPPGINDQRLIVAQAELAAQRGIAPFGTEISKFDAEREHIDLIDAERAQFRRAAMLAEREDAVETPVERAAISVTDFAAKIGDRLAQHLGKGPLDIDRRKIGHVGCDQRGRREALAMGHRGPRQIIGVLAFDQVRLEPL